MRKIAQIALVLAMTAVAWGSDNTLGSWTYNAGKSKPAAGEVPIASLTLMRAPAESLYGGAVIAIKGSRADGSKIEANYTTKYDGNEVAVKGEGLPFDTTLVKQINDNAISEQQTKKGGKYKATVQTAISKDGATMTVTAKGTGADGKSFTSVMVYDRQ
jgi:hypothetical protein